MGSVLFITQSSMHKISQPLGDVLSPIFPSKKQRNTKNAHCLQIFLQIIVKWSSALIIFISLRNVSKG